ncbi:hypothetical protein [Methanobrevibacter sp. DSM 116169]|uniref:hypothetical protein n=1 Tax=Methanobrevibacter sp. DSM 116169 TaxID=3242727 RepID=UPI0038FD36DA
MSSEVELAEIKGLLVGIREDVTETKKDISHIKNNDKDKLHRLAVLESYNEKDTIWREGHIRANQKFMKETNEKISKIDKKVDDAIKDEKNWRIATLVAFALVGFDIVLKFV